MPDWPNKRLSQKQRDHLHRQWLEKQIKQAHWNSLVKGKVPLRYPRSEYVTIDEAADIKNVSVSKIRRAIYEKVLPAEQPGNILLIRRVDLDATAIRGRW